MSAQGRLQESLAKFIESVFPNFDFMAMYSGVINAAGPNPNTFDFTPDSKLLAGLQSVQMFTGVPGVTITVDTSQSPRCFLGFAGGDPTQPYLALWAIPGLSTYLMKAEESITLEINTDGIPGAQEILSGQNIQLNPNTTIRPDRSHVSVQLLVVAAQSQVVKTCRVPNVLYGKSQMDHSSEAGNLQVQTAPQHWKEVYGQYRDQSNAH